MHERAHAFAIPSPCKPAVAGNTRGDWPLAWNSASITIGPATVFDFIAARHALLAALRLGSGAAADAAGVAAVASKHDRIASVRLLKVDHAQTSIQTREKGMRAGDGSFDGLLVIKGLDVQSVRAAVGPAATKLPIVGANPTVTYTTVFSLDRRSLEGRIS